MEDTGHVNDLEANHSANVSALQRRAASVVCGDINGLVWAWDLLDVCPWCSIIPLYLRILKDQKLTAKPAPAPPKAYEKLITWSKHPTDAGEMIIASLSADGTAKVWRYPIRMTGLCFRPPCLLNIG